MVDPSVTHRGYTWLKLQYAAIALIFTGSDWRNTRVASRVIRRQREQPLLERQDLRRMHRILAQPHAEQQLGHFQFAGQLAAD